MADKAPRISVTLTPDAQLTVDAIQRTGESEAATITRILETIAAMSPDFDEFFGPPRDGKGPSGT